MITNEKERRQRRNDAEECHFETPSGPVTMYVNAHGFKNYAKRRGFPPAYALCELQRQMKKFFQSEELARRCISGEQEEAFALQYDKEVFSFEIWRNRRETEIYLKTFWTPRYEGEIFHAYFDEVCMMLLRNGGLVVGIEFADMDRNLMPDYSHKKKGAPQPTDVSFITNKMR